MLRDQLDSSRIETGRLRIAVADHDAAGLRAEPVEMLRPLAAELSYRGAVEREHDPILPRCVHYAVFADR
jgi:hypothetical protein